MYDVITKYGITMSSHSDILDAMRAAKEHGPGTRVEMQGILMATIYRYEAPKHEYGGKFVSLEDKISLQGWN